MTENSQLSEKKQQSSIGSPVSPSHHNNNHNDNHKNENENEQNLKLSVEETISSPLFNKEL